MCRGRGYQKLTCYCLGPIHRFRCLTLFYHRPSISGTISLPVTSTLTDRGADAHGGRLLSLSVRTPASVSCGHTLLLSQISFVPEPRQCRGPWGYNFSTALFASWPGAPLCVMLLLVPNSGSTTPLSFFIIIIYFFLQLASLANKRHG